MRLILVTPTPAGRSGIGIDEGKTGESTGCTSHRAENIISTVDDQPTPERSLTARQYDVLLALRSGASNKEIAKTLDILDSTVKMHLKSIFRQLGVKNRTQAAMVAVRCGHIHASVCHSSVQETRPDLRTGPDTAPQLDVVLSGSTNPCRQVGTDWH